VPSSAPPANARPRLLLAEPSPPALAWLRRTFEPLRCEITAVGDGVDLLTALVTDVVHDLVIAELSLPVVSGAHVLASARTAGVKSPFLLLAPVPSQPLRALVRRAWPAEIIEEPFDIVALRAAAKRLLELRRPQRARKRAPSLNDLLQALCRLAPSFP
jgi:DNA-binding response OmpR family regulator